MAATTPSEPLVAGPSGPPAAPRPRPGRSVVDVAHEVLDRIDAYGDPAVWIDLVPRDRLLAQARRLDALAAADPARAAHPLFGVPFGVKGSLDVAGLPTTCGCPAYATTPDAHAEPVRRLVEAGALVVGTTNLDQFATGLVGVRSPYGVPRNTKVPGLVPGGSSSGSAVAVAAGLVPFAVATDTAGSGRVPAALNGIVGFKPSRGLVSTRGLVPACRSLDCVTVMAADVADTRAALAVMAAPDPLDPGSRTMPPRPRPAVGALRVGLPPADDLEFFGDDVMRAAHLAAREAAVALLGGDRTVPFGPLREASGLLYQGPWVAERYADLGDFIDAHPDDVLPVTRGIIGGATGFSAVDTFRAMHRLAELRREVGLWWADVDLLVLPTIGTTFTVEQVRAEPVAHNTSLGLYTQATNLLDQAAVSVPFGTTADGRPLALMLVGPAFSDDLLLAAAARLLGEPEPAPLAPAAAPGTTPVAVAGRHLTGESRNGELVALGAHLVETARTDRCYRLLGLPPAADPLPVLVRTPGPVGEGIEVEIWAVPTDRVADLLHAVPAPLALGRLRLADGREVVGFVGEGVADAAGGLDLTATGGWRHRHTLPPAPPTPEEDA